MVTKTCLNCGKEFTGIATKICCDDNCYNAWYYATRRYTFLKNCPVCAREYLGRTKGQKYCSTGCRDEASKRRTETLETRKAREVVKAPVIRDGDGFAGIGYLRESQFRKCECCGCEYICKYVQVTKCPVCRGVQREGQIYAYAGAA